MFNLIFPMCGLSSRFNYNFKPLVQISDLTFIELAFKEFKKYTNLIDTVYFIVTKKQLVDNNIDNKFKYYFKDIKYILIILEQQTNSQYETIKQGIIKENIIGECIICDCDHSIDITPMINYLNINNIDILVSCWNINENDNNWDKIIIEKNKILKFCNKEIKSKIGIIGCIYFKNIELLKEHNYKKLIEYFNYKLLNSNIKIDKINIINAEFFGTKQILDKLINRKKNEITTFCDIDGTIIHHEAQPKYDNKEIILNGVIDKLNYLKTLGKIIMTTSRNKRDEIEKLLRNLNIPYDDIITGLNSGPRILINDIKPSNQYTLMAKSYNVNRNEGMVNLNLDEIFNNSIIIKSLKGGSFSNTYIVKKNNNTVVRKSIKKNTNTFIHYEKLKLQKYNLERFNSYYLNLCPKILCEEDNDNYYYYDMEYLKNYKLLYEVNYENYFNKLFTILEKEIYTMKKYNYNKNWLKIFFENKVKINNYENLSPTIYKIINIDYIKINGINYLGLKKIMKKLEILNSILNPKYLAPIHGDLTLENIMICEKTNDIKLIDIDGCNFIDAIELDLGKLFQSTLSNYEIWSNEDPIKFIDLNNFIIDTHEYTNMQDIDIFINRFSKWKIILNIENDIELFRVGIYYMIIHLFRMIPFRFKHSENQAIYTIKEIIYWYNYIHQTL